MEITSALTHIVRIASNVISLRLHASVAAETVAMVKNVVKVVATVTSKIVVSTASQVPKAALLLPRSWNPSIPACRSPMRSHSIASV